VRLVFLSKFIWDFWLLVLVNGAANEFKMRDVEVTDFIAIEIPENTHLREALVLHHEVVISKESDVFVDLPLFAIWAALLLNKNVQG